VTWITLGNENHDSLISKSANHRPKLREHLGAVAAIMKLSTDWHDFRAKLNKLHPPIGADAIVNGVRRREGNRYWQGPVVTGPPIEAVYSFLSSFSSSCSFAS
jgi:hypothetical protein